jgi:ribosome maturation factor RimP
VFVASSELEKKLVEALEEVAGDHGIDIVDVEVAGSSKSPIVRVRLDNADPEKGTITLDDVSAQSPWVNEVVDAVDPFSGSYVLEISSPGLARPLRKEADFVRFAGETVSVNTLAKEGRRRYTGVLKGMRDGMVVVECDGEEFSLALGDIKNCKIKPSFD